MLSSASNRNLWDVCIAIRAYTLRVSLKVPKSHSPQSYSPSPPASQRGMCDENTSVGAICSDSQIPLHVDLVNVARSGLLRSRCQAAGPVPVPFTREALQTWLEVKPDVLHTQQLVQSIQVSWSTRAMVVPLRETLASKEALAAVHTMLYQVAQNCAGPWTRWHRACEKALGELCIRLIVIFAVARVIRSPLVQAAVIVQLLHGMQVAQYLESDPSPWAAQFWASTCVPVPDEVPSPSTSSSSALAAACSEAGALALYAQQHADVAQALAAAHPLMADLAGLPLARQLALLPPPLHAAACERCDVAVIVDCGSTSVVRLLAPAARHLARHGLRLQVGAMSRNTAGATHASAALAPLAPRMRSHTQWEAEFSDVQGFTASMLRWLHKHVEHLPGRLRVRVHAGGDKTPIEALLPRAAAFSALVSLQIQSYNTSQREQVQIRGPVAYSITSVSALCSLTSLTGLTELRLQLRAPPSLAAEIGEALSALTRLSHLDLVLLCRWDMCFTSRPGVYQQLRHLWPPLPDLQHLTALCVLGMAARAAGCAELHAALAPMTRLRALQLECQSAAPGRLPDVAAAPQLTRLEVWDTYASSELSQLPVDVAVHDMLTHASLPHLQHLAFHKAGDGAILDERPSRGMGSDFERNAAQYALLAALTALEPQVRGSERTQPLVPSLASLAPLRRLRTLAACFELADTAAGGSFLRALAVLTALARVDLVLLVHPAMWPAVSVPGVLKVCPQLEWLGLQMYTDVRCTPTT
jgi:hypothetical protein